MDIEGKFTLQVALVVKNPSAKARDVRDAVSIYGSGRFPGGGNGNPLQCSCLARAKGKGEERDKRSLGLTYTHYYI